MGDTPTASGYSVPYDNGLEVAVSSALCDLLGFLGNASQMPRQNCGSPPMGCALSARGPGRVSCLQTSPLCLEHITCHTLSFALGPSFSPSFCSSNMSSLLLPQAFASAVPTAWNAFPSCLHSTPSSSQLKCHLLRPAFPTPQPTPCSVVLDIRRFSTFRPFAQPEDCLPVVPTPASHNVSSLVWEARQSDCGSGTG